MYELKEISLENFELAKALKDSLVMANADYILGYAYEEEVKYDSAYYHYFRAAKVYKKLNNNTKSGEVILNMANIQNIERDYIGSEINAIEAKKLIEQLPETNYNLDTLWLIHNLLGVVSGKLKLYDKALEYHALAYKFASKMTNGYYYKITTSSNIASIYRKKAQYNVAVDKYNEILENKNLITYDSASYASTISNIAYAKFLSGIKNRVEIEKPYREAMHIAKDINNNVIEIYTYLYLSKYFEAIKQSDSAKKYINKAYDIAKATKTNDVLLESLILKASLAKDSSQQFLMEHIKLSDSLVLAERSIRNKFARIDYETEAFKQQKEIVSRQNILLIIASSILAITLLLLYVIKTRREKIKELQLAQQQQQANEEIYNLMLSQQDKMDEARAVEKKRISQDIHDGILGRLFGVRLNLDNLNFIKTDDGITRRSNYINELKEIEFDIRKVSHDLNTDFVTNSSFSGIIKTLVENQCDAYGLEYAISIANSINWELVSNKTKVHIYRITQESLQNIYKHAEASLVSITIDEDNNSLSLAISDDGKGFESDKIKDGIGLKNIKSRVQEINAKFNIKTTKNEGTTVEIEIPI
ncbi:sensor histidine kinase [Lacinutrix sp. Hel_I_90]|uniref:sensor histidine kinase n=1 Tax=Lacinutrix sp. Hel_I_90 TaxID=1249999 RepID=UPI0012E03BA8|nr:ATP-binding protein [Lacinutrix sp. Hel_I_90]